MAGAGFVRQGETTRKQDVEATVARGFDSRDAGAPP
jgi:hypothetical protein